MALSNDLDARFLGSWTLVSWASIASNGETRHPFGEDAVGYLFYTPDGHMAAHLMQRHRARFASDNLLASTPEERATAALEYFSYSGTFTVQPNAETVTHHVLASSAPNWLGMDQVRSYRFSENTLTLSASNPDGSQQVLVWKHN